MTDDRTILITGVTGNQGGAVAQALQGTGFHLARPDANTRQPAGGDATPCVGRRLGRLRRAERGRGGRRAGRGAG